jgi:flavin reductase (DIM6/NTAB) family NADH-FMN oxidoreductase RutF
MEKTELGANIFLYPMPVTLLGTVLQGRVNFMTLGWVTRVNASPPMLAVAVSKSHATPEGIREQGTFSVNIPHTGMKEKVDYCGLVSGLSTDKSDIFEIFYGKTGTAPMIAECPLCIECRLSGTVDLPTNTLFIGNIVESFSEERYLTGGHPDIKKINPLLLTMPDNGFWSVGERTGTAWADGKNYRTRGSG